MKSFARLLAAIAAWICILLPATGVAAEATGMPIPAANERGPRIAVVIGNAKYPSGSLANPRNDATAMAEALTLLGFQVDLKLDATKADIDAIFRRFSARADSAAVAALFYAGHGIQVAGSNYIVPIDANPRLRKTSTRSSCASGTPPAAIPATVNLPPCPMTSSPRWRRGTSPPMRN